MRKAEDCMIRTLDVGMPVCKVILLENNEVGLEFKRGKIFGKMSLEAFVAACYRCLDK